MLNTGVSTDSTRRVSDFASIREWEEHFRGSVCFNFDDEHHVHHIDQEQAADIIWRAGLASWKDECGFVRRLQPKDFPLRSMDQLVILQKEIQKAESRSVLTQRQNHYHRDLHFSRAMCAVFMFCFMPVTRAAIGMLMYRDFDGVTYMQQVDNNNMAVV
jgi:hypothetical protein